MRLLSRSLIVLMFFCLTTVSMPACKAKSCDTANNVSDDGPSKKRKKNIGLFSKKERRRKKW